MLNDHIQHESGRCKNVCTSAVLAHFGIMPNEYHYAQNADDVKGVLRRKGYSVRSRKSAVGLKVGVTTVGQLRKAIRKHDGSVHSRYYVGVVGHAMVFNGKGETVVDTAPRKRDVRKVRHISIVERADGRDERRLVDLTDAEVLELIAQRKAAK